jgi:DNA-binding transcriptional MerR regulator
VVRVPLAIDERTYTIAEVAERTDVTAHTLRYYERIGLLDVARHSSGHRRFTGTDLARVVFITRLRLTAALNAIEYKIAVCGGSCAP